MTERMPLILVVENSPSAQHFLEKPRIRKRI